MADLLSSLQRNLSSNKGSLKKTQQQPNNNTKKNSEEVLFCEELILKHLGLLIYFFQLFVILHGLK